jgi:hypothetical protein
VIPSLCRQQSVLQDHLHQNDGGSGERNQKETSGICGTLRNRGLPGKIINIIEELYNGFERCVLHNGKLTDPFTTVSGVRQGCPLSAIIFLFVLDEVLRWSLDGKMRGILWKLTEHLEDLDYADDIVLLSNNLNIDLNLKDLPRYEDLY